MNEINAPAKWKRFAGVFVLAWSDKRRDPPRPAPKPGGAFYVFFNIQNFLNKTYNGVKVTTDTEWCLELLQQKKVATVMGSAFSCDGYARASFAASMETLKAAFDRIAEFVAEGK